MSDFILGPQLPLTDSYFDTTLKSRALFFGRAFPATPPAPTDPAWNTFYMNHYYDLGLTLYITYVRTKDPEMLALFQKVTDSWFKQAEINGGVERAWLRGVVSPDPRHAGLLGLILRAADRPEMWDWINAYTRFHLNHWLVSRTGKCSTCGKLESDPVHGAGGTHAFRYVLFYGVRPGAFMLQAAAVLSKVLPDTFPLQSGGTVTNGAQLRSQYLADVEKVAVQYYGRLQQTDGSWRWDDLDFTDSDGGQLKGIMQPFMIGLLLNALIKVHQASSSETVQTSIQSQITKACRHLYSGGPYSTQRLAALNVNARGFSYFYHGGTTVNITRYAKGSIPADWNPTDRSDVQNIRQAIGLLVGPFGWCYERTKESFFKTAGDDLWDAAYGATDGIRTYMNGGLGKDLNQHNWAGSYLAWTETTAPLPPAPQPPAPSPIPPSPAPAPVPPPVTKPIVSITQPANNAVVSGKVTVSATATDSDGIGTVYLVVDGVVSGSTTTAPYSFTLDTAKLSDGPHTISVRAWDKLGNAGDANPAITITVENTVTPPPVPTPSPDPPSPPPTPAPCRMTASVERLTLPEWGLGTVTITLENMTGPTEIRAVADSGQVSVSPGLKTVSGTSAVVPFQVAVKKKGGTVTFSSGCGSVKVVVGVQ